MCGCRGQPREGDPSIKTHRVWVIGGALIAAIEGGSKGMTNREGWGYWGNRGVAEVIIATE